MLATLVRRSPVDERTGLIRWVYDLPIQPGEPCIFNCAVKLAEVERYSGRPCYDNNGGCGLTLAAARGAAIGEGLERYSASCYNPADLIYGTASELSQKHRVCEPERFALYDPRQRLAAPSATSHTPLAWVWGYSLQRREPLLVPACLVYIPYQPAFRERGEVVIAPAVSTGQACAPSIEEALVNGICEAVERDAFMISWVNRLSLPRVDIEACAPLETLYRARFKRDGLSYALIDMTLDIEIPSRLCVLIDERCKPPMICVGGAASFDAVRAGVKAMLEAVQTREWAKFLGPARLGNLREHFDEIRDFEDHVALYAYGDMRHALEFLLDGQPLGARERFSLRETGSPRDELDRAVTLLADNGLEVIAVDLTTTDVRESGHHVTKVLVPGLQPLDADYRYRALGGSRIYDVPLQLGFREARTRLEELNPFPHPYP
jgi:ribosomal protein S12 methylthiotransferase accessory factor